jgi:hypothetical protein
MAQGTRCLSQQQHGPVLATGDWRVATVKTWWFRRSRVSLLCPVHVSGHNNTNSDGTKDAAAGEKQRATTCRGSGRLLRTAPYRTVAFLWRLYSSLRTQYSAVLWREARLQLAQLFNPVRQR